MVILREATIKYSGIDPLTLSKGSHKKIYISCDKCGKIREIEFKNYKKLCKSCCQLGHEVTEKTKEKISEGNTGRKRSKENKIILSCIKQGISIEDFDGFIGSDRSHVKWEYQCTKLNTKFNNSEFHHLNKNIGIYIPKDLHQHIRHNLKTGNNMHIINTLACQFMNGGL